MANQKREWRDWEWWEHVEDLNSDIQPVATYGVQKPTDEFRKKIPIENIFHRPSPLRSEILPPYSSPLTNRKANHFIPYPHPLKVIGLNL